MTAAAKKEFPAWIVLGIIVLVAAALLAGTNMLTEDRIEQISLERADAARRSVMPEGQEFTQLELAEGAAVDNCYEARANGELVGHTAQVTVKGYGGPIEVIVGIDTAGAITAISVGGSDFAETAGLGSLVKEEPFMSQFAGITAPAELGGDINAITGATISSRAVTNGVNTAAEYIAANHGA